MSEVCRGCGTALAPSRGRPRKWCSGRCRKDQYGGECETCGARTDGSNGKEAAPRRCRKCEQARHAERNARVLKAWGEGVPSAVIARREGVTEHSVRDLVDRRRRHHGQPIPRRRRKSRELWPLVEQRWRAGATAADIADEFETTADNVAEMVKNMRKAGIDLPRRARARNGWDDIAQRWREGATGREIADGLGKSLSAVNSAIRDMRREGVDLPYRQRRPERLSGRIAA